MEQYEEAIKSQKEKDAENSSKKRDLDAKLIAVENAYNGRPEGYTGTAKAGRHEWNTKNNAIIVVGSQDNIAGSDGGCQSCCRSRTEENPAARTTSISYV
jgi:hypothetical protein